MARKKYSELPDGQRLKVRARAYANSYQRRGWLTPEPCDYCGEAAQKHHPDYSMPLEVKWLCRDCHLVLHKVADICREAELAAKCREMLKKYFDCSTEVTDISK